MHNKDCIKTHAQSKSILHEYARCLTVCSEKNFSWTVLFNITLRNLISFLLIIITFHIGDGWAKAVIEKQSINTGIAFWQAPL